MLTDERNLVTGVRRVLEMGPKYVVAKKGSTESLSSAANSCSG